MYPVDSRKALRHSPELRIPGAEALSSDPARYAREFLAKIPSGVTVLGLSRVVYVNFANDPSVAILMTGSDGTHYLIANELGPDAHGEVSCAARALAREIGVPYSESAPSSWHRAGPGLWARWFGYAE